MMPIIPGKTSKRNPGLIINKVPKNAIIHEDIFDDVCGEMLKQVKLLKLGLPDDPGTDLLPVIKISQYFEFLEDAKVKGGKVLCGGHRINLEGKQDERGIYIEPTLIAIDNEKNRTRYALHKRRKIFFPTF